MKTLKALIAKFHGAEQVDHAATLCRRRTPEEATSASARKAELLAAMQAAGFEGSATWGWRTRGGDTISVSRYDGQEHYTLTTASEAKASARRAATRARAIRESNAY